MPACLRLILPLLLCSLSACHSGPTSFEEAADPIRETITIYRLDGDAGRQPDSDGTFHAWPITAARTIADPAGTIAAGGTRTESMILTQARRCFIPRHGIRHLRIDGRTVDYVICFSGLYRTMLDAAQTRVAPSVAPICGVSWTPCSDPQHPKDRGGREDLRRPDSEGSPYRVIQAGPAPSPAGCATPRGQHGRLLNDLVPGPAKPFRAMSASRTCDSAEVVFSIAIRRRIDESIEALEGPDAGRATGPNDRLGDDVPLYPCLSKRFAELPERRLARPGCPTQRARGDRLDPGGHQIALGIRIELERGPATADREAGRTLVQVQSSGSGRSCPPACSWIAPRAPSKRRGPLTSTSGRVLHREPTARWASRAGRIGVVHVEDARVRLR